MAPIAIKVLFFRRNIEGLLSQIAMCASTEITWSGGRLMSLIRSPSEAGAVGGAGVDGGRPGCFWGGAGLPSDMVCLQISTIFILFQLYLFLCCFVSLFIIFYCFAVYIVSFRFIFL